MTGQMPSLQRSASAIPTCARIVSCPRASRRERLPQPAPVPVPITPGSRDVVCRVLHPLGDLGLLWFPSVIRLTYVFLSISTAATKFHQKALVQMNIRPVGMNYNTVSRIKDHNVYENFSKHRLIRSNGNIQGYFLN
uniref:Uncharacterized protein n=1 Tax=Angiostrongylus cantonensis TaxID=6313 RepID=A0A0K0CXB7_ANGCA